MKHKVEIYSTPNCEYCQKAKDHFKELGIEYTEYNVAEDAERKAEAVELTGRMGVPVVRVSGGDGDDVFYGWDDTQQKKFDETIG